MVSAIAALDKIVGVLDEEPEVVDAPGAAALPPIAGHVRFEGVRFRYGPDLPEVLDGLDLDVPAGTTVALVGHTGAGKSTIAKLLSRFYDPTAGRVTIGAEYASFWEAAGDLLRHLAMPTLAFTLVLLGEYMLIMRSSVLDVFSEDYILTAKAKGLSTFRIIKDHALRNAMLPMVTLIALNLAFTVSGAIQVEEVFSWPGIGRLTVEAIAKRDFPVLQGAFLLIAIAVVIANLLADLIYGWLDPRVTHA